MITFFGKTKLLEAEVDGFLYQLQNASLVLKEGITEFLSNDSDRYWKRVEEIKKIVGEADRLRRKIKQKLYSKMLIPDARGDVWELLDSLDSILNCMEKILENFYFERPEIPSFLRDSFLKMANYTEKTVGELVKATKSYFTNIDMVNEYSNKVIFYEAEVDNVEDHIKQEVFSRVEIKDLSHRIQLRYFAEKMALISDKAESACEKLSVFVLKREF
jgi:predicted phosphate transport protein (TIGR00153 family)